MPGFPELIQPGKSLTILLSIDLIYRNKTLISRIGQPAHMDNYINLSIFLDNHLSRNSLIYGIGYECG